jgi:alanine racemase
VTVSETVRIDVDLARVRQSLQTVRQSTGRAVVAVVKADAYGLGAAAVARAIADQVEAFYAFSLTEVQRDRLWETGKPTIVLRVPPETPVQKLVKMRIRPCVVDAASAERWRAVSPVLSVDTGQQRFACPIDRIEPILATGAIAEAMTHASKLEQVEAFTRVLAGRGLRLHAAGTALLTEPAALLDAVRPGLALYRGSVRVSARIVEARSSAGPAGYGGFHVPRFGVILCGYSGGLRPGPCLVNGRRSRVIEVGMQSSFIELAQGEGAGDEVVLLGDDLTEADVAAAWNCSPQEVLVRLCAAGERRYLNAPKEG